MRVDAARAAWVALFALLATGCASSLEVRREVSPDRAASMVQGGHMTPIAVVHGVDHREIPPDARIEKERVVIPNAHGIHVHKLRPGDVIEVGGDDRITAVRGTDGTRIVFVPGTAFSPEGTDEVHGQLAQGETVVPLAPGDRIEVGGVFEADEPIPGGGHVEIERSAFALWTGVFILAISYAPTAYVGLTSGHKGDRALVAPLIGPWIDLGTRPKCEPPTGLPADLPVDPCSEETANKVALVASGAAQALGGLLFAIGLPSHAEVVEDEKRTALPRLHLAPLAGRGQGGLAVVGTF